MPYNPDGSQQEYTPENVMPEQMREYRRQELMKKGRQKRSLHPKLQQARENQIRQLLAADTPQRQIDMAGKNFIKDFGIEAFGKAKQSFNTDRDGAVAKQEAQKRKYDEAMASREEQHFFDSEFAKQMRQRYGR